MSILKSLDPHEFYENNHSPKENYIVNGSEYISYNEHIRLSKEYHSYKSREDNINQILSSKVSDPIDFSKWCLVTERFSYDNRIGWYINKSLNPITWDQLIQFYLNDK